MAALVAGALSMAVGEYVSVSSQSDAERAFIEMEKEELKKDPKGELDELKREYMKHGVSEKTAKQVAKELTEKNALRAHLRMHFNIDPDDINNPMQAAIASLLSFTAGGLVPFVAVLFASQSLRIPVTIVAVIGALIVTGLLSATVGGASRVRATVRVVAGGLAAMIVTYYVGVLFGTAIS